MAGKRRQRQQNRQEQRQAQFKTGLEQNSLQVQSPLSDGVLLLPKRKVQSIGAVITVAFGVLVFSLAWQDHKHDQAILSKKVQLEEQQLVIDELDDRLLAFDEKYESLKKEISSGSMLAADKNNEIALLKEELRRTRRALNNKSNQLVAYKKNYQSELNRELATERETLATVQSQLESKLAVVQQQEEEVNAKISDVDEWEKKRAEFDKLYANSALEAQNEERVNELMGQFNQLRVDLDVINECDKDYLYRYNEAKSLLNNIRTFIQKYEMEQDFYFYVISNDSLISAQNRKLCLTD
ncbi:hypothetical protein C9I98_17275 [Photobacterium sanctipauli]|uniref:Uncharacterized protein n=1 Tax=Photobacterium sanctipauli TaxID=1342794 RepID=A0A2T3NPG2_9GAMM|nr:hypothetical protein [Photobacterium sanctipauli]PSW18138.1 hypothetical protein C9I98_17275 [Photobacterium sanctipauli]